MQFQTNLQWQWQIWFMMRTMMMKTPVCVPLPCPSSFLIIISSSSSAAGRKETAWQRLRQHSVPESCFVLEPWRPFYQLGFTKHFAFEQPPTSINKHNDGKHSPHQMCRVYLVCLSPHFCLSLSPMWMFEALGVSWPLGATEARNGAGLFQVLRHHLQDAGHLVRHRDALCLQDLPFETT